MLVLKEVYLDDAGTDANTPVAICAGYFARWRKWRSLDKKWKQVLRSYGMLNFSMKKFAHDTRDWSEERRRGFMSQLLNIVVAHVERGFVVSINKPDYELYVPSEARQRIGSPFAVCAAVCLGLVERYRIDTTGKGLTEKPVEHIVYTFEDGTKGLGSAIDACQSYLAAIGRMRYRKFYFGGKDLGSLNAVDIIAYESGKTWRDYANGKQFNRPRHPFNVLVAGVYHEFFDMYGPELATLEADIMQHLAELDLL